MTTRSSAPHHKLVILKAKFSSWITSGDKNRAWQEIVNIVNAGNSVKRDIKEIQKKWDNICATAKTEVSVHYLSIEKLKRNYQG
jgi:hypothetical protein